MRKALSIPLILLTTAFCAVGFAEDDFLEQHPMLQVQQEYSSPSQDMPEEPDPFSPEDIVILDDMPSIELPLEDDAWQSPAEDIDPDELPPEEDQAIILPETLICMHDKGLLPSSAKASMASCSLCGKPLAAITGARLEIGTVFTLRCYAELLPEAPDGLWTLTYTAPSGMSGLLAPQPADGECSSRYDGTVYRFDISGIRPQDMSGAITLQLQFNGVDTAYISDFSLQSYCDRLVQSGELTMEQLHLLADLLEYGYACQQYTGTRLDAPANTDRSDTTWIATLSAYRTEPHRPDATIDSVMYAANDQAHIEQVGLHFSDRIRLYATVESDHTEGLNLEINGVKLHPTGTGQAMSGSGVMPAALGQPSIVRLYSNDQLLQTMRFSGEAYINACWDDPGALGFLVRRLRALELSLQRCQ